MADTGTVPTPALTMPHVRVADLMIPSGSSIATVSYINGWSLKSVVTGKPFKVLVQLATGMYSVTISKTASGYLINMTFDGEINNPFIPGHHCTFRPNDEEAEEQLFICSVTWMVHKSFKQTTLSASLWRLNED